MVLRGFQQNRLMPMFLCPERSGNILRQVHELSTLVIEA